MLAGGGNLVQVFLHLIRLIDVGGSQSGKADDRIYRSADVVGHVVEEGCFGTVGVFRRVQCEVTPVSGALRDNGADPDHRGDQNAENIGIGLTTPPRTIGVRTKACQPACHCSRSIYAG